MFFFAKQNSKKIQLAYGKSTSIVNPSLKYGAASDNKIPHVCKYAPYRELCGLRETLNSTK